MTDLTLKKAKNRLFSGGGTLYVLSSVVNWGKTASKKDFRGDEDGKTGD
jgi:hypothetical protein